MLTTTNIVAVCIDIQVNLAQAMDRKEVLFKNAQVLLSGLRVLDVPIIVTEQYPKGMGPTIPEVMNVVPDVTPISKMSFSCCGDELFMTTLEQFGRKQVILAGIEAHVCVYQTARDLAERGYSVEVAADCISSRTAENKTVALNKMQTCGIGLTSAEIVLFDLLKTAESPTFRKIAKIVK